MPVLRVRIFSLYVSRIAYTITDGGSEDIVNHSMDS